MERWTVAQLLEATGGELVVGNRRSPVTGISLDSRRLQPDDAFVAIRGSRFDAHQFLPEAIGRGASCLVVSQLPPPPHSVATIRVPDTIRALGSLAAFHRNHFQIPVIAVTGSCGKTTTKELIAHLISQGRSVLKTPGTENNHIGLPRTLLSLSTAHGATVVELGSNHPGEIAYLASLASPTIAVITNVGPAHLEFFGSLAGVLREKLSLLQALGPRGVAIVPGDQLEVVLEAKRCLHPQAALMTFGTSDRCTVQGMEIRRVEGGTEMRVRDVPGRFFVPLPGSHNAENALAALTCAAAMGIPLATLQDRLATFVPLPLRSQIIRCQGLTIVNDCYNANPLSFARALEILTDLDVRRRIVIAGDMLELGEFAPVAHQAIGRLCAQLGVDVIVAVGQFAEAVASGALELRPCHVITCGTVEEVAPLVRSFIQEGDGLLIKGSRKLQLERLVSLLLQQEPVPGTLLPSHVTRSSEAVALTHARVG